MRLSDLIYILKAYEPSYSNAEIEIGVSDGNGGYSYTKNVEVWYNEETNTIEIMDD